MKFWKNISLIEILKCLDISSITIEQANCTIQNKNVSHNSTRKVPCSMFAGSTKSSIVLNVCFLKRKLCKQVVEFDSDAKQRSNWGYNSWQSQTKTLNWANIIELGMISRNWHSSVLCPMLSVTVAMKTIVIERERMPSVSWTTSLTTRSRRATWCWSHCVNECGELSRTPTPPPLP